MSALRIQRYTFEIIDPKKGDLHGETFKVEATSRELAEGKAVERCMKLSLRLTPRLVEVVPTKSVSSTAYARVAA